MKIFSKKTFILLFFLIVNFQFVLAQNILIFKHYEDTLKDLGKEILFSKNDEEKTGANKLFIKKLKEVLQLENSFNYSFDSIASIARMVSPDNKFRLFNWHLQKQDGTYEYYGFIQMNPKKCKDTLLYQLIDKSHKINNPDTATLDCENWYGAHYYKIIYEKNGGRSYYTLLGWDGNNLMSTKKIIDILAFDDKGKPRFGAAIFDNNDKKKKPKRIIFEYSKNASMSLRYEQQYMLHGRKRKWMIIFDRLVPLAQNLEGVYCYYVPATNIFDAYYFEKGRWKFVKDIDARNPPKKVKRKKVKYRLFPEK